VPGDVVPGDVVLGGAVPGGVLGGALGGDVENGSVVGTMDGASDADAGERSDGGVAPGGDEASNRSNSPSRERWARAVSMPVPQSW
jgi:hypothetical protein